MGSWSWKEVASWRDEKVKWICEPFEQPLREILESKDQELGFVIQLAENEDLKASSILYGKPNSLHELEFKEICEGSSLCVGLGPVVDYYKQNKAKVLALGHTHPPEAYDVDEWSKGAYFFKSLSKKDYKNYKRKNEQGEVLVPQLVACLDLDSKEINIEGYWEGPISTRLIEE